MKLSSPRIIEIIASLSLAVTIVILIPRSDGPKLPESAEFPLIRAAAVASGQASAVGEPVTPATAR